MDHSEFTFGSLFAGIGGIDLGLERSGMVCKWQVEIDPFCKQVLAKHWPNVRRHEDVRECGRHNLEAVGLICGGFPCQPHSVAGKRRGAADDRNLWPEFIRIVTELRPCYVLAENVPGIITTYLDTVLSDLENADYTARPLNIPACAFDADHIRYRVFVVAYDNKQLGQKSMAECEPRKTRVKSSPRKFDLCENWLDDESNFCRTVHGVPNRMDRRRVAALGNAVVPQVAEWIGHRIIEFDKL